MLRHSASFLLFLDRRSQIFIVCLNSCWKISKTGMSATIRHKNHIHFWIKGLNVLVCPVYPCQVFCVTNFETGAHLRQNSIQILAIICLSHSWITFFVIGNVCIERDVMIPSHRLSGDSCISVICNKFDAEIKAKLPTLPDVLSGNKYMQIEILLQMHCIPLIRTKTKDPKNLKRRTYLRPNPKLLNI